MSVKTGAVGPGSSESLVRDKAAIVATVIAGDNGPRKELGEAIVETARAHGRTWSSRTVVSKWTLWQACAMAATAARR